VWISLRARFALIPVALVPLAVIRAGVLAESDTFWQIRTGLDILRTHRIPVVDTYSWTAHGREWHPNSWLFDVLLAVAYRSGGLALAALSAAVLIPVIAGAVAILARRLGAQPGVTLLLTLLGLTPLVPWLSARPQIVDYPSVVLLVILIDIVMTSASTRARWAAVGAAALLQVVWVNLHLAAMIGVGIAAACTAGHLLVRRSAGQARWAAAVVSATAFGTIASPFGISVFAIGLRVQQSSTVVTEWGGLTLSDYSSLGLLAVAVLAVAVSWRQRWYALVLPMAGLTVAGCFSIRLLPFAAVLGLPALAAAVAHAPKAAAYLHSRRALVALALCGLLAAEATVAVTRSAQIGRARYPLAAIQALPNGCRLFNSYQLGGPVILLRPDIPVSQDSRSDLYGTAALVAAGRIESGDGRARLDELGVTCVLVEPSMRIAADLSADPGWRSGGGDEFGTVFVRRLDGSPTAVG
jgi:hypothetical protein